MAFTHQSDDGHGGAPVPSAFTCGAALQQVGFLREQRCLMTERWMTYQRFVSCQPVTGLAVEPRARKPCRDGAAPAPPNKGCPENLPNALGRGVRGHTASRSRQSQLSCKEQRPDKFPQISVCWNLFTYIGKAL